MIIIYILLLCILAIIVIIYIYTPLWNIADAYIYTHIHILLYSIINMYTYYT